MNSYLFRDVHVFGNEYSACCFLRGAEHDVGGLDVAMSGLSLAKASVNLS